MTNNTNKPHAHIYSTETPFQHNVGKPAPERLNQSGF